ncbi:MAG: hypothetical protein D6748_04660 [Calditrichaeota bacterium]|nr:MAG: hypothetical protein D6748_04660 [Calditrichota bacterium]
MFNSGTPGVFAGWLVFRRLFHKPITKYPVVGYGQPNISDTGKIVVVIYKHPGKWDLVSNLREEGET